MRRLPLACLGTLTALALTAAPATALSTPSTPSVPSGSAPVKAAKKQAKVRVWIISGLYDGGKQWQLQGGKVGVHGNVKPYVRGQTVLVTIRQGGHKLVSYRVKVHKGKHGKKQCPERRFATGRHAGADQHDRPDQANEAAGDLCRRQLLV